MKIQKSNNWVSLIVLIVLNMICHHTIWWRELTSSYWLLLGRRSCGCATGTTTCCSSGGGSATSIRHRNCSVVLAADDADVVPDDLHNIPPTCVTRGRTSRGGRKLRGGWKGNTLLYQLECLLQNTKRTCSSTADSQNERSAYAPRNTQD